MNRSEVNGSVDVKSKLSLSSFQGGFLMSGLFVLVFVLIFSLTACLTPPEPSALKDEEAPDAPIIIAAIPSDASIMLSWEAVAADDLAIYMLHWGTNEADLTEFIEVAASETSADVEGLTNGATYHFALEAKDNSDNVSERSVVVQGSPVAPDITAPIMSSTTPNNNATGVEVTTAFVLNFSEAMDVSSLTFEAAPVISLDDAVWNDEFLTRYTP